MSTGQLIKRAAIVAGAVGGGLAARSWARHRSDAAATRWLMVTINCAPQDVMPGGRLPDPLADLADLIEVQVRPAPGDKGTELGARLVEAPPPSQTSPAARLRGEDPRQPVRRALRETKALLEVGEVMLHDHPPTTHPGPGGKLVQAATRIAYGEGRL